MQNQNQRVKRKEARMPSKEQVERVTNKLYTEQRQSGRDVSREQVRAEVVKRAQRIDNKKNN
jgi:hypothetical protein